MGQIETVRYEKLLYFYCALKDLQSKSEDGSTTFGVESDLDSRLLSSISETLASTILADDQSTMSKICFATLAREANRRPKPVSEILHATYLKTGSNQEVIKAFFSGDLMGDLASVQLGFRLFSSLTQSEERYWALKPCQNCLPSAELDELIIGMIS